MAKVLVTGGCGFVGRHLVSALQARGDDVRVLDVRSPKEDFIGVDFRQGSILDAKTAKDALHEIECLYHIAGIPHLWARSPQTFDDINRRGTETMLEAAASIGTARIVHCSTESILLPPRKGGVVQPVNEQIPLTVEDMPGPYTRSKFLGEQAALHAARNGMNLVVVNPTIPIGAGDDNMTPPAMMLELFLRGGSPMFLDCILNFVDVRDVADGIILAGDRGRAGQRYILGGENLPLRDLLGFLEQVTGRKMPRRTVPGALALTAGIVSEWISRRFHGREPAATREGVLVALRSAPFDSSKAKTELGYAPSPIEGALKAEIAWLARRNGISLPAAFSAA
ncbi:NAD-dependent epimerase/dehydratase family protein [Terrihabitans sp. B22-R8]|uniref:NAD-dependent epimerase/dehydratase family protein n=1 Tax=Terrihabitans sp. B22-R8 TaxID=3425128 RepID=UPI00403C5DD9